jgi:hypothetical protein
MNLERPGAIAFGRFSQQQTGSRQALSNTPKEPTLFPPIALEPPGAITEQRKINGYDLP